MEWEPQKSMGTVRQACPTSHNPELHISNQLQPISDARSVLEGCLRPTLFALPRVQEGHLPGRSRKAVKIGPHVPAKGSKHNLLPGKTWTDQKD